MNLSNMRTILSLFIAYFMPLICNASPSVLDLTYVFNKNTPNHPRLAKFDLRVVKRGLNKYGTWVEMNDFFASEHSGTHIDAPVHFSKSGKTVDQIPIFNLYRVPAVMIDVRNKVRSNVNYEITAEDIEEWVDFYGGIPDGGVILFQTGWGKRAFTPGLYSGIDQFGKLNFPGLGRDAAEWIVRYRNQTSLDRGQGIVGVGIDTMSVDVGQSVRFPAKTTLYTNGLYGLESVANIDKLPPRGFTITVMPMKIGLGSGAPARIVAEMEGVSFTEALTASAPQLHQNSVTQWLIATVFIVVSRLVLNV